jgi:ADP-ribose pyrophosphatase
VTVRWERLSRETVFEGRVVELRRDRIRLVADGREKESVYDVVHHRGSAAEVALFEDDTVALIRQFRYPVEETIWEIPAGTLSPGETFRACAERELEEETGHRAGRWHRLARFFTTPGFCDEIMEIWLAEGLEDGETRYDEDEHIEVVRVPFSQAVERMVTGEIRDAKTLVGLWMAHHHRGGGRPASGVGG